MAAPSVFWTAMHSSVSRGRRPESKRCWSTPEAVAVHGSIRRRDPLRREIAAGAVLARFRPRDQWGLRARRQYDERDGRPAEWLRRDDRSRTEDLMIVELLPNDVARAASTETVRVLKLMKVEPCAALRQLAGRSRST